MATQSSPNEAFTVKRGKVDSLTLFEVTESELRDLERGTPADLLLNFSIFLFSVAISFFISLLTTQIASTKTFCVFVIFTVIGFVSGVVLFCLWLAFRKSKKMLIQDIRARMPSDEYEDKNLDISDVVDKTPISNH